ncbi:hypothetical protein GBF38_019679, partial [Nibea albiflora]
ASELLWSTGEHPRTRSKLSLQRSATPSVRVEDVVTDYSAWQHVCQDTVQHLRRDREEQKEEPIHMLQCTTLQKAAQKPMVSFHRQGGLGYVAVCCQGQQQPGKSCQRSARKSRAATKHTYLCCALMMRKNKARSGLIGSILSMEICACTTEGELPVHSDKSYEETPISQQPQDGYMTA